MCDSFLSRYATELQTLDPRTRAVVGLSAALCGHSGVTVPPEATDRQALERTFRVAREFATRNGLRIIDLPPDSGESPLMIVTFPQNDFSREQIALVGHLDVVPAQAQEQFVPRIVSGMLVGRGTADMKTVVATYLQWMAEQNRRDGSRPPFTVMISGTEENGSLNKPGVGEALRYLREVFSARIGLAVVGERTGELETMKDIDVGPICDANRGWRWYRIAGDGRTNGKGALRILTSIVRAGRQEIAARNKDLSTQRMETEGSWRSGFVNPFAYVGADVGVEELSDSALLVTVTGQGASRHSAAVSADEISFLEQAERMVSRAESIVGADNVLLVGFEAGEDGNFNSVTGGGRLRLVVAETSLGAKELTQALGGGALKTESEDFRETGRMASSALPIAGLDIREIPEHTVAVREWIAATGRILIPQGFTFQTINDGDGWVCPARNRHFQNLQAAYREVIGKPPPLLGKRHGNDGRFFDGQAVVWGQVGIDPHGPAEAHQISSIQPYLRVLDHLARFYSQ